MEICELEKVQGGGGVFFQLEAHWLYIYQLSVLLEEKSLLRATLTATFPQHVLKLPEQLKNVSFPELCSAGWDWAQIPTI